jgi:hypothetical protein
MSSFNQYSNILLDGFASNPKSYDIVNEKRDLLEDVLDHYGLDTTDVLFVGFSPWCMTLDRQAFSVCEVGPQVQEYLTAQECPYQYHSLLSLKDAGKKFQVVVAADEYFTFADSDQQQRELVEQLAAVTSGIIITTLRDYKNQDFKDREFSQPIMIRDTATNKIYLEHYEYDIKDKNASVSRTYVISGTVSDQHGPFARRNMYFKQLAKFSIDAGAQHFYVHKNLMYKSVIKKNYEHVITIKF